VPVFRLDVDANAARIEAAGGTLLNQPEDRPWGARVFQFKDPDGFKLGVSTPLVGWCKGSSDRSGAADYGSTVTVIGSRVTLTGAPAAFAAAFTTAVIVVSTCAVVPSTRSTG